MVISQSFSLSFLIQWWGLNTAMTELHFLFYINFVCLSRQENLICRPGWPPPASDSREERIKVCTITNWLSILYSVSHSFLFIVSLFPTRNNNKYIYFFPHSYLVYSLITSLFFIIVTLFILCPGGRHGHAKARTGGQRTTSGNQLYLLPRKFSGLAASTLTC